LIEALQRRGLRVDPSDLYLACTNHGIAQFDARDRSWTATGGSTAIPTPPASPGRALTAQERTEQRVDAQVRRLLVASGVSEQGQTPPPGPVPAGWSASAKEAARALLDELHAVSKRRVLTDIPLVDGVAVNHTTGPRLMRFEAEGELGAQEGTSAELLVAGATSTIGVEIVSVFGNVVTLAMPSDAPQIRSARLRIDLSWLLRRQSNRLHELVDGGPGFHAVAALAAVTPPGPGDTRTPVRLRPGVALDLNEGQRSAVELALSPGLTWLWGPPGTGKTTTLAALVTQLADRGQRILLAAPTNAALDVAVKAILTQRPRLADGDLVRLGQPSDPALIGRAGGRILVDEIAAERGAVAAERVEVAHRLREHRAGIATLKRRKELTAAEQNARLRLETAMAEDLALAKALDRAMMELRRDVCRRAALVAATAHQVVLDILKEQTFDVVILDEASMTPAALTMLVAGAGKGHTVIAGDFRQLPPVALAETPASQLWLSHSSFERAGIPRAVADGRKPRALAALTEQYRMRDAIGEVISAAFYPESPLIPHESVSRRTRRSRARWTTADLIVLDTTTLAARTARRQGFHSRYNLAHVQVAAGLLGAAADVEDLAVVTPFAPQARLHESLLPDDRTDRWAGSTVHRFQGGERDIVVYDTVDTGRGLTRLHRWFTDGFEGSDGARLLNVAASRARDHLVVIGALNNLHRRGAERDAVWTFFAHLLDRAVPLSWSKAIAQSAVTEHVESGIVQRLGEDIARAQSVDMWLPGTRLDHLPAVLPMLRMVPRGENSEAITVWVEPQPDGHLPTEALQARREGINIRPVLPILESLAVIGDAVWSSSGSLLGPQPGVVLRTEDRSLADAVRRAQRRRSGPAPGSGQLGDNCGRCMRMLIRYEIGPRGQHAISHECFACDRLRRR
jgi:hypothetical protein